MLSQKKFEIKEKFVTQTISSDLNEIFPKWRHASWVTIHETKIKICLSNNTVEEKKKTKQKNWQVQSVLRYTQT